MPLQKLQFFSVISFLFSKEGLKNVTIFNVFENVIKLNFKFNPYTGVLLLKQSAKRIKIQKDTFIKYAYIIK